MVLTMFEVGPGSSRYPESAFVNFFFWRILLFYPFLFILTDMVTVQQLKPIIFRPSKQVASLFYYIFYYILFIFYFIFLTLIRRAFQRYKRTQRITTDI